MRRRRFLESVLTQRNLVGAFASFAIQCFAAPFGLFPPWMAVIGMAPFYLMILLGVTSLIWARGVWFPPEEEEARRAERAAERAAESARHEAEIEAAKNIQPPPIVQWALRRSRDTQPSDE